MIESSRPGRIWIVEDSPLEAEMARRALAPAHDVELYADGSVALERISSGIMPDVVILDWQLPGLSGLDVCRAIRATHDPMALPVLILTAYGQKPDTVEALAAGANDYVAKPFDIAELTARVSNLVRIGRLNAEQSRRARQLALSADIGASLTKGMKVNDTAQRCVAALVSHLGAIAAEVWTKTSSELSRIASHRSDECTIPEELVRAVAESRVALVTDHVADDPSLLACKGASAFAALPLVVHDEAIGVVSFATQQLLEDSRGELTTLADLMALGVARTRFEEERASLLARERGARADAEAANRSKDEFLATVSHELRTPLNAITGWTGMIIGGTLDEARTKRALETIDRNARAQAQLIDDLLDISRIISGKLRLEVGGVDVISIGELALESVRLAAEAKGVRLVGHIDPNVGTLVGDTERFQQIVWNLLSNAIKFTPKGGTVTLSITRSREHVSVTVEDTGQGIASEFLPYVFDRFKQADGSATRIKGGLGLGLAIVRRLVELHGGTVEAFSEGAGKGAKFVASFPTSREPQRLAAVASIKNSYRPSPLEWPREIEGLRILVVDDEPDARDLVRALLESCKVEVVSASSAAEAFEVIRQAPPDVVLSDIAMPEEDGLALIRRIRALPREQGGRVPAVALTAYARLEDRTRALRAGFNGHVAKPIESGELLAVVASVVAPH